MPTLDEAATLADRFLTLIRPKPRNPHKTVEDDDYVAMLLRMVRALEARCIDNPATIADALRVEKRMREVVNVAIAANAERYAVDPRWGASMKECARLLGISPPSASERKAIGDRIIRERLAAAGATKFSEAKREREMIREAEAAAVVVLADYRARHAA